MNVDYIHPKLNLSSDNQVGLFFCLPSKIHCSVTCWQIRLEIRNQSRQLIEIIKIKRVTFKQIWTVMNLDQENLFLLGLSNYTIVTHERFKLNFKLNFKMNSMFAAWLVARRFKSTRTQTERERVRHSKWTPNFRRLLTRSHLIVSLWSLSLNRWKAVFTLTRRTGETMGMYASRHITQFDELLLILGGKFMSRTLNELPGLRLTNYWRTWIIKIKGLLNSASRLCFGNKALTVTWD